MRGEVLHFDNEHGFGFITGTDGKRYTFEKTNLRREFPVSKGTLVEFQPIADKAHDVFLIRGVGNAVAATADAEFGRFAVTAEPESTGLWSYFSRGITTNYANFRTRARRKEYWGFALCWWIAAIAISLVGFAIDQAFGFLAEETPYTAFTFIGLFFLATFIPGIAMQVRRQHDIGLSGWFILLVFVPYIGNLILLVFGFIPSQKHDNKWGPIPYGVRV
ncbi:MAG TPA: DUF805 domain-containing protein [Rhizobiaceae bacterium]|nr:DUF805 domain-containing protein [Rhizobiaceae bacterium]